SAYRKRGYEAQIKSDLRNAATAEEAYFASTQPSVYKSGAFSNGTPAGYNQTVGVTMNAAINNTNGTFLLTATHSNCAGVNWTYISGGGVCTAVSGGCRMPSSASKKKSTILRKGWVQTGS